MRRGPYLVQDTLVQINRAKEVESLKKPLKVGRQGGMRVEGVGGGGPPLPFPSPEPWPLP